MPITKLNFFRFFICLFLFSFSAEAQSRFDFRQKADKKAGSRWTLQEWLEQRDRNRMMDLWLAMYAPSPYEFYIKGSYHSYKTETDPVSSPPETSYTSGSGGLGAYATIVGLEVDYENNTAEAYSDLQGAVNLRIMGNAVQGTHLIIRYGQRTRNLPSAVRITNPVAGADLNLYVTKYFGLMGSYDQFLDNWEGSLGTYSGSRSEAGGFIDFGSVRLFGNWFKDIQKNELAGVPTTVTRTGVQSGLQFFF